MNSFQHTLRFEYLASQKGISLSKSPKESSAGLDLSVSIGEIKASSHANFRLKCRLFVNCFSAVSLLRSVTTFCSRTSAFFTVVPEGGTTRPSMRGCRKHCQGLRSPVKTRAGLRVPSDRRRCICILYGKPLIKKSRKRVSNSVANKSDYRILIY